MSNETAQTDPIAILTRDVIRGKIADLNARERDLVALAYEAHTSGRGSVPSDIPDDVRRRHHRVKAMLNGAGSLLPELPSDGSANDVETQLGDVRFALATLNQANLEAAAIDAARWAIEATPAWRAKVRKLVTAMAALVEADDDCTAFIVAAGGERANVLPHLGIYRSFAGIELSGWTTLDQIYDVAIDEGVVKAAELKGARHAR
jgi:hypothetical protein